MNLFTIVSKINLFKIHKVKSLTPFSSIKYIIFLYQIYNVPFSNYNHFNMIVQLIYLSTLSFFFVSAYSYKQFFMTKSSISEMQMNECTNYEKKINHQQYSQACYQKDISYRTDLYIENTLYFVSLDLTTPVSWLKSPNCKSNPSVNCSIIRDGDKLKRQKQFDDVRMKFKLFSGDKKWSNNAEIVGSTDKIQGHIQNVSIAQFYAKDSKVMKQFLKIMAISLFISPEKESIKLTNISFVTAEKLTAQINQLADGAISLKPGKNLANIILLKLINPLQTQKMVATIYLNPKRKNGIISIGQISLKYSKSRPSQINWVNMKQSDKYGYINIVSQIQFSSTDKSESAGNFTKNLIITTSSSLFFLPQEIIQFMVNVLGQESNAHCTYSLAKNMKCSWDTEEEKRKIIDNSIYFVLNKKNKIKIPLVNLINIAEGKDIQFLIRESASSEDVVLGQPVFEEYLIFFDYANHKLGFTPVFVHYSERYSVLMIYFIRFIFMINIVCKYMTIFSDFDIPLLSTFTKDGEKDKENIYKINQFDQRTIKYF